MKYSTLKMKILFQRFLTLFRYERWNKQRWFDVGCWFKYAAQIWTLFKYERIRCSNTLFRYERWNKQRLFNVKSMLTKAMLLQHWFNVVLRREFTLTWRQTTLKCLLEESWEGKCECYLRITLDRLLGIRADWVKLDEDLQEWSFH